MSEQGCRPGRVDRRGMPLLADNYTASRPPAWQGQLGGCGIASCVSLRGERIPGDRIARMLTIMEERENGLGAGYACYGLFPDRKDQYCLQFFFDDEEGKHGAEEFLSGRLNITHDEKVFTSEHSTVPNPHPIVWRYFADVPGKREWKGDKGLSEDDYMVELVQHINEKVEKAFCISSGRDMAVFKGNGYSHEIAELYDVGRYSGTMWLSHSRFPTNSPAWWAGAHPMSLLDWGVCHNGEITSYGVNRKLVEMNGYRCTVLTDTEVVAYMWDLLVRRNGLPIEVAAFAMAPRTFEEIALMPPKERRLAEWVRITYREAFLNGPFSIIVGRSRPETTLIALADRKKLRPLIAGLSPDDSTLYIASEECSMRIVEPGARTWAPEAGNPLVAIVGKGVIRRGIEDPFLGVRS
jgi:glutamate synthase domain-containing protein 1